MKLLNIVLLILMIICIIYTSNSQDFSPLSFSTNYTPSLINDKYKVRLSKINLNYPLINTSNTIIMAGINCRFYEQEFKDNNILKDDPHYIGFPLMLIQKLDTNSKFMLSFEMAMCSDKYEFISDNFKYSANMSYIHSDGNITLWALILAINKQFGGITISPNLYLNIQLGKELVLGGALPFNPKITYLYDKNNQYGLAVSNDFNTFRLSDKNQYTEEKHADINIFYQYRLSENFKLNTSIGYIIKHSFDIYKRDDVVPIQIYNFSNSRNSLFEFNSNNGIIFKVRIFWSTSD